MWAPGGHSISPAHYDKKSFSTVLGDRCLHPASAPSVCSEYCGRLCKLKGWGTIEDGVVSTCSTFVSILLLLSCLLLLLYTLAAFLLLSLPLSVAATVLADHPLFPVCRWYCLCHCWYCLCTAAAFDCTLIQASQKAMLKKRATLNKFTSTAKAEAVAKDLRGRGSPARRVRAGWRRITRHQPNPHAKKVVRASLLTVFKQCLSKCWCSGRTCQKVCHAEVFPENVQSQGQPLRQPLCQPLLRVHIARRIPGLLYRDLEKSNNRTIRCQVG